MRYLLGGEGRDGALRAAASCSWLRGPFSKTLTSKSTRLADTSPGVVRYPIMGDGFADGTFPLAAVSHGTLRCALTGERFNGTLPLAAASPGNSLYVDKGDGLDEGILPLIVASHCCAW